MKLLKTLKYQLYELKIVVLKDAPIYFVKKLYVFFTLLLAGMLAACSVSPEDIKTSANGDVITDLRARGSGRAAPFDGTVDTKADLHDLLLTARGDASLDLHRGHDGIRNVLEAYLGISHDEMHIFMDQKGLNLAGICRHFGFDPENLVATLTASFTPFIDEGMENGVILKDEAGNWTEQIRAEFSYRVYWEGK